MAEEAWKVVVRQQVGEAVVCSDRASGRLAGALEQLDEALGDLATQALVDDPRAWRDWAQRADRMLADASPELAAAASIVRAAGLIALRGAAASPEAPLRSVADVPDEGLRGALARLEDARDKAGSACDQVDLCRSYLAGALRLLEINQVKSLVHAKLVSARDELEVARNLQKESAEQVYDALLSLLL
ncbi:hypothetical protein GQ55_6G090300 [Panicum hallii var. hallii]|uniref:Uncharacterized protein n=1 Tax=Panicum hallii var. hallii TaxID=1504633 RepID=A0A2T7D5I0_9POAL|nr:hypothetical protein GQ55_6G090300 [Panicum hallii var. hallii]